MSEKPERKKALSNFGIFGSDHNGFMKKSWQFFAKQVQDKPEEFGKIGSPESGFHVSDLSAIEADELDENTKIFVFTHGGIEDLGEKRGKHHYVRINSEKTNNSNIYTYSLVTEISKISQSPKQIYFASCLSGNVPKMVQHLQPGSMIMSFSTPDGLAHNPFSENFLAKLAEKPDQPITELIIRNFGSLASRGAFIGIKPKSARGGAGATAGAGAAAGAGSSSDEINPANLIFFENYLSLDSLMDTDEPIHVAVSKRLKEIIDAIPDEIAPDKPTLKQIQKFLIHPRDDLGTSRNLLEHNMKQITRWGVDHYLDRELDYKGQDPRPNLRSFSSRVIKEIDEMTPIVYQTMQHYKQTEKGGIERLILDVAQNVISKGANINGQAKDGNTALLYAAEHCPTRVVDFLLERGADPFMKNNADQTLLHLAAKSGNLEIVSRFSSAMDINAKDKDGLTPLDYAMQEQKYDVAQALLVAGAKPLSAGPLKRVLLLGPDWIINDEVKAAYSGEGCLIIGDTKNLLTKDQIKAQIAAHGGIDKDTVINICGHGIASSGTHGIQVLSNQYTDPNIRTSSVLETFSDLAKSPSGEEIPLQIHLYSCYAGAAAKDVEKLTKGSTLICHGPDNESTLVYQSINSLLDSADENPSRIVRNLFQTFVFDHQGVTIGIKDKEGAVRTSALRAPDRFLTEPEEISRYIHAMWNTKLEEQFRAGEEHLPDSFKLDEVPSEETIRKAVIDNYATYQYYSIVSGIYSGKIKECTELISKLDPITLNAVMMPGKDNVLYFLCSQYANNLNAELIETALKKGCDPTIKNEQGKTPLEYLFTGGIHSEYGVDVSSIVWAINKRMPETAKALIKLGVDTTIANSQGKTALHFAVTHKQADVIELLLENGANINACDTLGKTAFMNASGDCLKQLLQKPDINVHIKDKSNKTTLDYCLERGDQVSADFVFKKYSPHQKKEFLLKTNKEYFIHATRKFADELKPFGREFVHTCLRSKNPYDMLKHLDESGFNVNEPDEKGATTLHIAAQLGNVQAIKFLHERGANVNAQDKDGKTPLMYLAESLPEKFSECLNELKKFDGFDPKIEDAKRRNAMEIIATSHLHIKGRYILALTRQPTEVDETRPLPGQWLGGSGGFGSPSKLGIMPSPVGLPSGVGLPTAPVGLPSYPVIHPGLPAGFHPGLPAGLGSLDYPESNPSEKATLLEYINIAVDKGNTGAAIEMVANYKVSPLLRPEKQLCDLLLKAINLKDKKLISAICSQDQRLLHIQDDNKMTPIMHAVEAGDIDVLQKLIKKRPMIKLKFGISKRQDHLPKKVEYIKVDFDLKNKTGHSILDLAAKNPDILALLEKVRAEQSMDSLSETRIFTTLASSPRSNSNRGFGI